MFLIVLGFFVWAGLGEYLFWTHLAGVIIGLLLLLIALVRKKKFRLPKGWLKYLLFLVILEALVFVDGNQRDSFTYWLLLLSSGLFWVLSFNCQKEIRTHLSKAVISLGLVFSGMYVFFNHLREPSINAWSLYLPTSHYFNHNNIGDLWSVVMVGVLYKLVVDKKVWKWLWLLIGVVMLGVSQSRSAYLGLVVGVCYLLYRLEWGRKYKKIGGAVIGLGVALFVITGAFKTTLGARDHYVQAVVALWKHPLGVGLGNFGEISGSPSYHLKYFTDYSDVVFSWPLEMMVSMGWLGLIFIWWFIEQIELVISSNDKSLVMYQAMFLGLTVNLIFNLSYYVPSLLWLWFVLLGVSAKDD